MKLTELINALVNENLVTDKELESASVLCCDLLESKKAMFRVEAKIKELCDFERLKPS